MELIIGSDRLILNMLFDAYGPLVGGMDLVKALGYPTSEAFRQSCCRRTVPINVFSIRNGKYALVTELADWLIQKNKYSSEGS